MVHRFSSVMKPFVFHLLTCKSKKTFVICVSAFFFVFLVSGLLFFLTTTFEYFCFKNKRFSFFFLSWFILRVHIHFSSCYAHSFVSFSVLGAAAGSRHCHKQWRARIKRVTPTTVYIDKSYSNRIRTCKRCKGREQEWRTKWTHHFSARLKYVYMAFLSNAFFWEAKTNMYTIKKRISSFKLTWKWSRHL